MTVFDFVTNICNTGTVNISEIVTRWHRIWEAVIRPCFIVELLSETEDLPVSKDLLMRQLPEELMRLPEEPRKKLRQLNEELY